MREIIGIYLDEKKIYISSYLIIHEALAILPVVVVDPLHGFPLDRAAQVCQTVSCCHVKTAHSSNRGANLLTLVSQIHGVQHQNN